MSKIVTDNKGGTPKKNKSGSKPGVARGPYKDRRAKAAEPQTPEELAELQKRCREYWGDEWYDQNCRTYAPELGRIVSMRTYLPPDYGLADPDQVSPEITSKVCRSCKLDWELSYFSPSATGRGGVKATCKICLAEAAIEYASTPRGKAARARAQAKFRAAEKALERHDQERKEHLERMTQSPAGRAFLEKFGLIKRTEEMLSPANFISGGDEISYLKSGPSGAKS